MIRPSFVTGARPPPPDVVSAVTDHQRASEGVLIVAPGAKRSALRTAALAMMASKTAIEKRIAGSDETNDFLLVLA